MRRTSKKPSKKSLSIPIENFSQSSDKWTFPETMEDENTNKRRGSEQLSRTQLLLLDYRQFKAARSIQRFFLGWFVRRVSKKKQEAAIKIQTEWRRFYAARFVYRMLENRAQQRTWEYFHRAATRIQSLWRGWWVRENIHDQYRLVRMQERAAEELLYCVAFKLHHMLRTYQVPGVYSLRNSHCLSKVERLLSSMHYKHHNDRIRVLRLRREARKAADTKHFENCVFRTDVPYAGPDFKGLCIPMCTDLYNEKDADIKMHRILSMYQATVVPDRRVRDIKAHPKGEAHKRHRKKSKKRKKGADFCADVVKSMRRWKILNENKLSVDPNVFREPENVEKFLAEIQSVYSILQDRCHCHTRPVDKVECLPTTL